jgi:hypothetical protein
MLEKAMFQAEAAELLQEVKDRDRVLVAVAGRGSQEVSPRSLAKILVQLPRQTTTPDVGDFSQSFATEEQLVG